MIRAGAGAGRHEPCQAVRIRSPSRSNTYDTEKARLIMFHADDSRLDALMKLPALKGAALAVFVALLIAQKPLTREELTMYTGWARDAITDGIRRLGMIGAIVDRGRYGGWELAPNWQQLPLPLLYLGNGEGGNLPTTKAEKSPSPHTRDLLTFTTTTKSLDQEKAAAVTRVRAAKAEKPPSPAGPVKNWLIKGGIAPSSPKMYALLALDMDPDYVKAHVLNRLAALKEGNDRFGVGMLIRKFEDDDPAPPMRCEECLQPEEKCDCRTAKCPNCGEPVPFEGYRCICQIIKR